METQAVLKPGETFALPLTGRGSSGYAWSYEISGNSDAVEVRIEGPPEPLRTTSRPIAGSVDQKLVVKAVSPGKVNIRLVQRRSWERDKPPLAEQSLTVIVQA